MKRHNRLSITLAACSLALFGSAISATPSSARQAAGGSVQIFAVDYVRNDLVAKHIELRSIVGQPVTMKDTVDHGYVASVTPTTTPVGSTPPKLEPGLFTTGLTFTISATGKPDLFRLSLHRARLLSMKANNSGVEKPEIDDVQKEQFIRLPLSGESSVIALGPKESVRIQRLK